MNPDMFASMPSRAEIGQKVNDFKFETFNPATGGFEEHALSESLAKDLWVVFFFYPADFTFVCPTELADLANSHAKLQELGVDVYSVSTDTKFAHLAWKNSEKLLENVKFQMVADGTGKIFHYFGVHDSFAGTAYRGTFIINPDGVLVSAEVNFYNVGRNAEELVRKIEANVHLRKNPTEVCPPAGSPTKKSDAFGRACGQRIQLHVTGRPE
jgi:peroxiredoxin (alkyl hydroperoxide reductase subunit C)